MYLRLLLLVCDRHCILVSIIVMQTARMSFQCWCAGGLDSLHIALLRLLGASAYCSNAL